MQATTLKARAVREGMLSAPFLCTGLRTLGKMMGVAMRSAEACKPFAVAHKFKTLTLSMYNAL